MDTGDRKQEKGTPLADLADLVGKSPTPSTPRLTEHARERCAEMGIGTKVAKRIWQERTVVRPGVKTSWGTPAFIVTSENPKYVIVVVDPDADPIIVTVAFRTDGPCIREGGTYRTVSRDEYTQHWLNRQMKSDHPRTAP